MWPGRRCRQTSPMPVRFTRCDRGSLFEQQSLKTRPTEARQVIYLSFVLPEGRRVITNSLSLEVVRSCKQTNKPKSLCVALATVQLRNRQFHLHRTDRARATSARLGVFLWKAPGGACNWGASSSRPSYAVEERAQPLPPTPSARSHHENIPILPIQQCPHPRLKSEGGPAVFSSRVACRVDGVPPGIRARADAGHPGQTHLNHGSWDILALYF